MVLPGRHYWNYSSFCWNLWLYRDDSNRLPKYRCVFLTEGCLPTDLSRTSVLARRNRGIWVKLAMCLKELFWWLLDDQFLELIFWFDHRYWANEAILSVFECCRLNLIYWRRHRGSYDEACLHSDWPFSQKP